MIGDANASATASFTGSARFDDPASALGTPMKKTILLHIDRVGSDGSTGFGQALATANVGVSFWGNVSDSLLRRSDASAPTLNNDGTLTGIMANGASFDLSAQPMVQAEASFYNVDGGAASSDATSDASNSAHFYIDGDSPTM